MKIGRGTSRGWVGVVAHSGKVTFCVAPRGGVTLDFDRETVLKHVLAKPNDDFVTAVRTYARHWWSLGRPSPWTLVRRARQYGRWQRGQRTRESSVAWPYDGIYDDPAVRIRIG